MTTDAHRIRINRLIYSGHKPHLHFDQELGRWVFFPALPLGKNARQIMMCNTLAQAWALSRNDCASLPIGSWNFGKWLHPRPAPKV